MNANALVAQMRGTSLAPDQCAVFYLGQNGFLVKEGARTVVFDPYLTDYVDRHGGDKAVWRRRYPAPVPPEALDFVDDVVISHAHIDHADPDTLRAIAAVNPRVRFHAPAPVCAEIAAACGVDPARFRPAVADEPVELGCFRLTPVPAAHETLHRDAAGHYRELGYLLDTAAGRLFHAGDMCPYDGLEARLAGVKVAFLPVNGRDDYRRRQDIVGNFTCEEAILLAKACGIDLLVPMHYDLYAANGLPESIIYAHLASLNPNQKIHTFRPGERLILAR